MELLDIDEPKIEAKKVVQCKLCHDIFLESDFVDHAIEEHSNYIVALVSEDIIVEKFSCRPE